MQPTPVAPTLPVPPTPAVPGVPAAPAGVVLPASAVPAPIDALPEARRALVVMDSTHLRRCVFRRVSVVTPTAFRGRSVATYDVLCGHPSLAAPLTLGDLPDARTACGACRLPGLFRADED